MRTNAESESCRRFRKAPVVFFECRTSLPIVTAAAYGTLTIRVGVNGKDVNEIEWGKLSTQEYEIDQSFRNPCKFDHNRTCLCAQHTIANSIG